MTHKNTHSSQFQTRHIGPRESETNGMLSTIGVSSMEQLVDETIPSSIRVERTMDLPDPVDDHQLTGLLRQVAAKNKVWKSYLGQGYFPCIIPPVLQRSILENPGWYTQYTPYQAEISQGRLEALLNFQTLVSDLTAMEVANASLLDEGTAAAEAMTMVFGLARRGSNGTPRNKFFVSEQCFLHTREVLLSRAEPLGIDLVIGDHTNVQLDQSFFGVLIQYPGETGSVDDCRPVVEQAKSLNAFVIVATDLLSLTLLTPPGEFGADVVIGNSQRFGVPMWFGGPHAAFFATKLEHVRSMPGRIIGVSIDAHNAPAYRMTLQTREQHIRREKATSNICTAQALLAIMAGMYAVYHGPAGLRQIATRIHRLACLLDSGLRRLGYSQLNKAFFDTLDVDAGTKKQAGLIRTRAVKASINLRYISDRRIGITLDETTTADDIETLLTIFKSSSKNVSRKSKASGDSETDTMIPPSLKRASSYLTHPVFNTYHSETEMMRYIKSLENKDLSLVHSMIPLGSCTMKLNSATELLPVSWPEFANIHPFAPPDQAEGYRTMIADLEAYLCEITGLAAASLQPNSGAQGEFTGLSVIAAYHRDRGDSNRTVVLIPSSAHGTNPASAIMAGLSVVVVRCDDRGNIDVDDLKQKAESNRASLAALMVTYPSTHGVFEENIREICRIVHDNGGLVYMDGANMNAQVGLTNPAAIGADVCHLNLHKTFAIPHGGGGPGVGPICVHERLAPYLPRHPYAKVGGKKGIHPVASAPWGSAGVLVISYAYIRLLGAEGLTQATRYAILNANYLKEKLEPHYPILYEGARGRVAHEFILNTRVFKESAGIEVEDIAKRLMDYGFHAPTVSFPVAGTLMIEPTESEPMSELDRFVDAMVAIRREIADIENGKQDRADNVLKHAPHTASAVTADEWTHTYPRSAAAFPVPSLRKNKFWPPVGRINNTYGDRNLVCSCPPLEAYEESRSDTQSRREKNAAGK